jgi:hypothetical protein
MPNIPKRTRRRDPLGERIFMCNGVVVDSPDVNHSININNKKVECSCGSILRRCGYTYHIKNTRCLEYHKLVRHEAYIKQYI